MVRPPGCPLFCARRSSRASTLLARYRSGLRFTNGRKYQKMVAIDQVHAVSLYRMGLTVQFQDIAPYVAHTAADLAPPRDLLGPSRGGDRSGFADNRHGLST
jgi:hypothetical protein